MCVKVSYATKADALYAMKHAASRRKRRGAAHKVSRRETTVYQCPGCRAWHLASRGSMVKPRKVYLEE